MAYFDFHHHHKGSPGIYNLAPDEDAPSLAFSAGLHPKDLHRNWQKDFERVKALSLHPDCMALGECGLDAMVPAHMALQEEVFRAHLLWAGQIRKPVIIHCVRKFYELIAFSKTAKTPLVVHGFNKKREIGAALLKAGFYLSFGKAALGNVSLQEFIKTMPADRMFLETDDKDFPISSLYEKVAGLRNISTEKLQTQISENLDNICKK